MLKNVFFGMMVLACVALPVGAEVIALDTFENHTAGDPLVSYSLMGGYVGLTPDIGSTWKLADVQPENSGTVTDLYAADGSQAMQTIRIGGGGSGVYTQLDSGVAVDVTKQYVVTVDYYLPDDGSDYHNGSNVICAGPNNNWILGWNHNRDNNQIECRNGSGYEYLNTGFTPALDTWYEMKMVVTIGADDGAGNYALTYDMFVTDDMGVATPLCNDLACTQNLNADGIAYGLSTYVGSGYIGTGLSNISVYDNLQIEMVPEPATMSLLGLGLLGLIRRKRA